MKKKLLPLSLSIFMLCLVFILASCEKDELPGDAYQVQDKTYYSADEFATLSASLNLPDPPFTYSLKDEGLEIFRQQDDIRGTVATLGRVLFYDKNLSIDHTVSCSSCHKQELAFSDNKAFSDGVNGRHTARNSIALGSLATVKSAYGNNSAFFASNKLFWDARVNTFKEQMTQTIQNEDEMGMPLNEMVNRVSQLDYYRVLFNRAFASQEVTSDKIMEALEEFMSAITNNKSRFDLALAFQGPLFSFGIPMTRFTQVENQGAKIFSKQCVSCHHSSVQRASLNVISGGITMANNGLDIEYADNGIGLISKDPADNGKFKIPVLRNIALTGPFMHDGRFETLEEVIDFYNTGIQPHVNLDHQLKVANQPRRMNLTEEDKLALIAFLKSLTDEEIVKAEQFSDPFRK